MSRRLNALESPQANCGLFGIESGASQRLIAAITGLKISRTEDAERGKAPDEEGLFQPTNQSPYNRKNRAVK